MPSKSVTSQPIQMEAMQFLFSISYFSACYMKEKMEEEDEKKEEELKKKKRL